MMKKFDPKRIRKYGFLFLLVLFSMFVSFCFVAAVHAWSEVPPGGLLTSADPLAISFEYRLLHRLYLFAIGPDGKIYVNTFAALWSGWSPVRDAGQRDSGPTNNLAATVFSDGRLYLFQETSGNLLRVISTDGTTWSDWWDFPASANSTGPAATVFRGNSYLFVRSAGDNTLRYTASHHPPDRRWVTINPGTDRALSRLSTTVFNNALYVVYRGLDNGIYYLRSTDGASWGPSVRINPGTDWTSAGPAAVVLEDTLYVVYRGLDHRLYMTASADGARWGPSVEVPPGGAFTDQAPTATAFNTQLYLFRKGFASDGRLYVTRFCSPPRIDSISPNHGRSGEQLNFVWIRGAHLQKGALSSMCNLRFGEPSRIGSSALIVSLDLQEAAVGPCTITLDAGCGPATSVPFTIDPPLPCTPPTLEGIHPARGRRGDTLQNVEILGSNLRGGALSSPCGIVFENIRNTDPRALVADFNLAMATPGSCTITVATGCSPPSSIPFTVDDPMPARCAIDPPNLRQGDALDVTITCDGLLLPLADLRIDNPGVSLTDLAGDGRQITAHLLIDNDAPVGTFDVGVITGFSMDSVGMAPLTIQSSGPPEIASMTPSRGARGATHRVVITGKRLLNANVAAQDINVMVSSRTETSLTADFEIPAEASLGSKTVTVSNDDGQDNSQFLVTIPPPAITWIRTNPPTVLAGDTGVQFTITGTNLLEETEFGISAPILRSTNPHEVIFYVRQGSTSTELTGILDVATAAADGSKIIELIHSGGTARTSLSVTRPAPPANAPIVTGLTPLIVTKGETRILTISGQRFTGALGPTAVEIIAIDNTLPGAVRGCQDLPGSRLPSFVPIVPCGGGGDAEACIESDTTIKIGLSFPNAPDLALHYGINLIRGSDIVASTATSPEAAVARGLRVIPRRPVVDSYTPSQPLIGQTHGLILQGYNLKEGAENPAVRSTNPKVHIFLSDPQANTAERLAGTLFTEPDAAPERTTLVIETSLGRCALELVLTPWAAGGAGIPEVQGAGLITTPSLSDQDTVDDLVYRALVIEPEMPRLIMQRMTSLIEQERITTDAPPAAGGSEAASRCGFTPDCVGAVHFRILDFRVVFPIFFCPEHGRYNDLCVVNLGPNQRVRLQVYFLSLFLRIDGSLYYRGCGLGRLCFPTAWPRFFSLRYVFGFEAPGAQGAWGRVLDIDLRSSPQVRITKIGELRSGVQAVTVELVECSATEVSVAGRGESFTGTPFAFSFNFEITAALRLTPDPARWRSGSPIPDVISVAWINRDDIPLPPENQLTQHSGTLRGLPAGRTFTVADLLNDRIPPVPLVTIVSPTFGPIPLRARSACCEYLARLLWQPDYLGDPSTPQGMADRQYVNWFLLKFSPNTAPPIRFESERDLTLFAQRPGNYRLFQRISPRFEVREGRIATNPEFIPRPEARVGDTPNPCGRCDLSFLTEASSGQAHSSNNSFCPAPRPSDMIGRTSFWHLSKVRVGWLGQRGFQVVNGIQIPWIWSQISFDVRGSAVHYGFERENFPTYWVYKEKTRDRVEGQVLEPDRYLLDLGGNPPRNENTPRCP